MFLVGFWSTSKAGDYCPPLTVMVNLSTCIIPVLLLYVLNTICYAIQGFSTPKKHREYTSNPEMVCNEEGCIRVVVFHALATLNPSGYRVALASSCNVFSVGTHCNYYASLMERMNVGIGAADWNDLRFGLGQCVEEHL